MGFEEISQGVHVWRYPVLDVNITLVTGRDRALLVDTLSAPTQARELAAGVRAVTGLPVAVVNTHAHFDHTFGNATIAEHLGAVDFHAHPSTIAALSGDPGDLIARIVAAYGHLDAVMAAELPGVVRLAPNRAVARRTVIDLGDRTVAVWPVGHAHSPGDLVVEAGDVMIVGDIVEEGAPPHTGDADLPGWVAALTGLLPVLDGRHVVPGHGAIVDAAYVARQRDELAAFEE